jgi:hypothetical protein
MFGVIGIDINVVLFNSFYRELVSFLMEWGRNHIIWSFDPLETEWRLHYVAHFKKKKRKDDGSFLREEKKIDVRKKNLLHIPPNESQL